MVPNLFLLAADNDPSLLSLLREHPDVAKSQDEHGYSLVHAAASYNHLVLLRVLVTELGVDVNIVDEDNETALFVVETLDAAKTLVELGINIQHKGLSGLTAAELISSDGDYPDVAIYLNGLGFGEIPRDASNFSGILPANTISSLGGLEVTLKAINEAEADAPNDVDEAFRRQIEELAQREDFNTAEGQADLRRLVEDAIARQGLGDGRNVKSKYAPA